MKRKTAPKSTIVVRSLTEAQTIVAEIRTETLNLNHYVNTRDAEKASIDNAFESMIDSAKQSIAVRLAALQAYAETHPEIFVNGRKSFETEAGTFGFRTDPKSVQPRSKFSFAKALEICLNKARRWVRQVDELDKEAILTEARVKGDKFDTELLAECGLKIAQAEKFYVDPILEAPAKRATEAA
jgi:phage host-nuclease inhibitor protein Gam